VWTIGGNTPVFTDITLVTDPSQREISFRLVYTASPSFKGERKGELRFTVTADLGDPNTQDETSEVFFYDEIQRSGGPLSTTFF